MSLPNPILFAGCAAFFATALWMGLCYKNRTSAISRRQLLFLIIATGLLCRVTFLLATPIFYAPDEQPHYKYIKYLAKSHELPVQTHRTDDATNDWEYYQPPIYYLSLVPIYSLIDSLYHDESMTVRALRTYSIFLWIITVIFALKLLKNLKIEDSFLCVFVISMLALLPSYTFLSSVINNDNLCIALGSAILCRTIEPASLKNSLLMGVLLGLALLTKLTAIIYIGLIGFLLATGWIRKTLQPSTIPFFLVAISVAFLI
jgi:hypothetical protein